MPDVLVDTVKKDPADEVPLLSLSHFGYLAGWRYGKRSKIRANAESKAVCREATKTNDAK